MHRRQAQNLTPPLPPQLLAHDPIHPASNRLPALVHQHARIVVEGNDAAVRSLVFFRRAHDDGVPDVAAPDFVGRADGDGVGVRAEVALALDYYYYSVACVRGREVNEGVALVGRRA